MRIKTVAIENFRSIQNLECEFDSITSLIGPNGAGKSNILRALDWFFNGGKSNSLSADDLHRGSENIPGARIRVRVDFVELSDHDREALGPRYCPDPDQETFTAWRTWHDGDDKITGRALAYPPFEEIRATAGARDKNAAYKALRESSVELGLPAAGSAAAVDSAMDAWERANPSRLFDAEVSDTHFFGVAGQGRLSSLFDFVFVSADLRAAEETSGSRDSLLSRILQRAVSREQFDAAATSLSEAFANDYNRLSEHHLAAQLDSLAEELTGEVATFVTGRSVVLSSSSVTIRPVPAVVEVQVADLATTTPVTQQGHGFQRTLLLAALTVLSRRQRTEGGPGQMFLAIEEPELFQHPTQARAFASVLRSIASDPDQRSQVAYATHSPYFVDPAHFDEVRRVSSYPTGDSNFAQTCVTHASLDSVVERLSGFVAGSGVRRRLPQVCLKYLPAALFAERVILVEGEDDAAILEGVGSRVNDLAVQGICVAPVHGKQNLLIPFAILTLLEIPVLMVVDNDQGLRARMEALGRTEKDIQASVNREIDANRKFCRYVGEPEEDYPVGVVGGAISFVPDTLETLLASDLPGWDITRRRVIDEGRGVDGKNAATYEIAARECSDELGEDLSSIIDFCQLRVA